MLVKIEISPITNGYVVFVGTTSENPKETFIPTAKEVIEYIEQILG